MNAGIEAIVASLIAVLLELVPSLNVQWNRLNGRQKQAVNLAAVTLIVIGGAALRCYRGDGCPTDWFDFASQTLLAFVLALTANQGVHRGTVLLTTRRQLIDVLKPLSVSDINSIAIDAGFDPDDIPGETSDARAAETVLYAERRSLIPQLTAAVRRFN